jgi:glycerol-3-phosphate acyltransferase PlsY
MLNLLIIIALSYLLGSIPTSIILSRIHKGIDIRDYGSKNAGAANVYRVLGPVPAFIVLFFDAAKGLVAVVLISQLFSGDQHLSLVLVKIIAGLSAVLGHIYPVYVGFKGGKGIGTGLGVLLALVPREAIMALGLFLIVVAATRYVSLGSLAAAAFISLALIVEKYYLRLKVDLELLIACLFLAVLVFFTHRSNIKRLLSGTEDKFGRKDK